MASEIDNAVNDIITQIKDHTNNINTSEKKDTPDITNLEEFLIEKTSSLITSSIDMVEDVKEYISSAPENRDVASLAIDTLTKLHTSTEQNKNRIEVKQMDVDSKEKLNTIDNQTKVLLSRDDVLQVLTNSDDSDVIDI